MPQSASATDLPPPCAEHSHLVRYAVCSCQRCQLLGSCVVEYNDSMQSATGQSLMAKPANRKQIGGEAIHVGDCQGWVEIYYLDSQTDYREYLPHKRVPFRSDEFLLLCPSRSSPRLDPRSVLAWGKLLLFFGISWLFMYFIWDSR